MRKLTYYNRKDLAKELTKGLNLSRSTVELLDSIFFWALQKNTTEETVAVSGRTRELLFRLERETNLIKCYTTKGGYLGAKLLGEWELDNTWVD